jgi:hypothetical protein
LSGQTSNRRSELSDLNKLEMEAANGQEASTLNPKLLEPSRWERLVVKRPGSVMGFTLFVSLALAGIGQANFPTLSQGGFSYRSGPEQSQADAFQMLGGNDGKHDSATNIFYDGDDLLTETNLNTICEFETRLFQKGEYENYCQRMPEGMSARHTCFPWASLILMLYAPDSHCEDHGSNAHHNCIQSCTLRSDWQTQINKLAEPKSYNLTNLEVFEYEKNRRQFLDKDFSVSNMKSRNVKTQLAVEEYEDFVSDMFKRHASEELRDDGPVQVFFVDEEAFFQAMMKDMMLVLYSIVIVFFYLWYNTQSLFLTSCGMFEIILSFPLAFFVWSCVFQQKHYGILMMMTLFIILGIGADDIFVLQDAWRQSAVQPKEISGCKQTRFCWAYRRAANAMTVTSFTTFMAFIAAALTPVPSIRSFGVYYGLYVLCVY